ncbi:heme o synthase [Chloroflexota bacterium]
MSRLQPSTVGTSEEVGPTAPRRETALWRLLVVLFKLRVVMLLLLAAVAGAFVAANGWPGSVNLAVLLVAGGLAAAGASAINQYLEQGLDARMERTRRRPLASGALARPGWVPYVGLLMIVVPSLAVLPFNPALAAFLAVGAVIYVWIYTVWLKPRTPLNIVIGGAAGSAAVLSGSAAAGAWNEPGALGLALLVFLWTPTHFWSLAIAYRDDYARGEFPMLPVQTSPRAAATWVLLHTTGASIVALALIAHPALGLVYLVPVGLVTVCLLILNVRLVAEPRRARALALFHTSNLYLALVMLTIVLDTMLS